jgi:hypothetical protein
MFKFVALLITIGAQAKHEVVMKNTPKEFDEDETEVDGEYMGTVYIGTPPQAVSGIIFDTGSVMPWLLNKPFCENKANKCSVPAIFDGSKSSTFKYSPTLKVAEQYGTGYMHAVVATDKFCFDKGGKDCMSKPFQFGSAYKSLEQPNQGIFGLAPQAFDKYAKCQSFISQANATVEDHKAFSIYYSKDPKVESKVIFGPPEAEKYGKPGSTNADLKWVDVVKNPNFSF